MSELTISDLKVGDRVVNPSQRSGTEYEVTDVREKQTFDGTETVFDVRMVNDGKLVGTEDTIFEKDHGNWERV